MKRNRKSFSLAVPTVNMRQVAAGVLISTTGLSMALNILAFVQGAESALGRVLGAAFGLILPLLILACSGWAFESWKHRPKKTSIYWWSLALTCPILAVWMLGLSIPHLAHGIIQITGVPAMEAWQMAVAIDLAMAASKVRLAK